MSNSNYLPYHWKEMSDDEKKKYYYNLQDRLLEHRYRYYFLDDPILEDCIYDFLEETFKTVGKELGLPHASSPKGQYNSVLDMVDWDVKRPGALEASKRVEEGSDHYTRHEKDLKEVWNKIGPPRYVRKSEG